MNFKNILIFSVFLFSSVCLYSQNEPTETTDKDDISKLSFKERLTFNIAGGVAFGTYTNINLQPQLGYRITTRLTSGLGLNFMYLRDNRFQTPNEILVYGGNLFTRYSITQQLFAQAEYQALQYSATLNNYVMVGAGYAPGGGVYISAFYLLLYPPNNNIYGSPFVFRVGFGI